MYVCVCVCECVYLNVVLYAHCYVWRKDFLLFGIRIMIITINMQANLVINIKYL